MGHESVIDAKRIRVQAEIWLYICPVNPDHYYAAPDWNPRNHSLGAPQSGRNSGTGIEEDRPSRLTCPYCKGQGIIEVERVPHIVTEVVPFLERPKHPFGPLRGGPARNAKASPA